MISHLGFSAWITCDELELSEFEVAVDPQQRRVTCWIASIPGKTFTIHWRDHGSTLETATYLKLDGFSVPGRFLYGSGTAERSAIRVGSILEKPFQFSTLAHSAPQPPGADKTGNQDIGTISVKVKHIRRKDYRPSNGPMNPPGSIPGQRKKGEPCIEFGNARQTWEQVPQTWTIEPYDPKNRGSIVTFVFRYRSREFLVSQGIMPAGAPIYRPLPAGMASTPKRPSPQLTPPVTPSMSSWSEPRSEPPSPTPSSLPRQGMNLRIVSNPQPGTFVHDSSPSSRSSGRSVSGPLATGAYNGVSFRDETDTVVSQLRNTHVSRDRHDRRPY